MKTHKLLYILPLAALVACEPEFEDVDFNQGSADFSRTVAVGNSLTAGYQSNALSAEGQINSLPNIIAQQLKQVGGGDFKQPIIPGEAGIKGAGVNPNLIVQGLLVPAVKLSYSQDCRGKTSLGPVPPTANDAYSGAEFIANVAAEGPYNNVGVPGAQITHLNFAGYAQANPYFGRFAASPTETVVEAAMKTNHTFFQLWIGNNDVLGYALAGGEEGSASITASGTFGALYARTLDSLTKKDQKGIVANIPDITAIPHFTTIKWNGLEISAQQASGLNAAYATYNAGLDTVVSQNAAFQAEANQRKISFSAGTNGFVIIDNTLTDLSGNGLPSIRQITMEELLVLSTPQDSLKCAGWGSQKPIPGNFTLIKSEIDNIQNAVGAYNATIKAEANARGLALVDANKRLNELKNGITISGINFNSELVTGGAFSLDGVHPSTRGYAILANDFIHAINRTYNANIPIVDVASYSTIEVE
jgi:hypothetical protein